MKLYADKCHLMKFGEKSKKVKIRIGEAVIEESDEETLLGIALDTKLSCKTHLHLYVRKASQELHELSRISIFMDSKRIKLMMILLYSYIFCIVTFQLLPSDVNVP